MQLQNNGKPGEDSIKMSADEEREELTNRAEADAEPADEGVGAMTDNKDEDPATKN
ncbi:hypothetical protein [Kocuria atrinae]|uniref:Uncharacterized protein n=1 Tax=Kocuria atrinae TaxID=592377 RepID=A0ABN2XJA5_9MICC